MEDRSGGIWVSSEFTGISHLWKVSPKGKQLFPFSSDDAESSNFIKMIKTRNDGSVEVSTRNGWLLRYNDTMTKVKEKRHFEKNVYSLLENGKETLAQVFTDVRYTKKDSEAMSENHWKIMKKQGF